MKIIVILWMAALLWVELSEAFAQSDEALKLTWDVIPSRANGDPINENELDHSTVIWVCNGKEGSRDVPYPSLFTTVGAAQPGLCTYYVTVTDKDGLTSERSEPYVWEGPPKSTIPPIAPDNIQGEYLE